MAPSTKQPIPAEIANAVYDAARRLKEMGAEIIEDVPMPNTRYGIPAYFVISRVEAASNLHRYDGVKYGYRTPDPVDDLREMYKRSRAQGFGLQPKLRILMGMYVSAAQYSEQYYQRALRVRTLIRRDFDQAFDPNGAYRLDALLTPTTPTTAFPHGRGVRQFGADAVRRPAHRAGQPRRDPRHLPAGRLGCAKACRSASSCSARIFPKRNLLRIGRAYEIATQDEAWRNARPQIVQGSVR